MDLLVLRILILFISIELLSCVCACAQTDSTGREITIKGKVFDENAQPLSNAILINKRSKSGQFGKSDGTFTIKCLHTDTIAITTLGYHTREFSFGDSVHKDIFNIEIYLDERWYPMPEVVIFAPRDLEKIQKDIAALGFDESDYMLSGINAAASPITFLYQQFSKKEQSKRLAAKMENEDKKRDLLKELFHHYVSYDIIDLDDAEFDTFIDYLNVSEEFLKSSTQYDFLIYVRDRFDSYKKVRRKSTEFKSGDYDYDKD